MIVVELPGALEDPGLIVCGSGVVCVKAVAAEAEEPVLLWVSCVPGAKLDVIGGLLETDVMVSGVPDFMLRYVELH